MQSCPRAPRRFFAGMIACSGERLPARQKMAWRIAGLRRASLLERCDIRNGRCCRRRLLENRCRDAAGRQAVVVQRTVQSGRPRSWHRQLRKRRQPDPACHVRAATLRSFSRLYVHETVDGRRRAFGILERQGSADQPVVLLCRREAKRRERALRLPVCAAGARQPP